MSVKLLTERHLEFLSLKVGYISSSECTLVTMPHFWKSHVAAHFKLSSSLAHVNANWGIKSRIFYSAIKRNWMNWEYVKVIYVTKRTRHVKRE